MAYDWKDFVDVEERWMIVFGEHLGIGFGVVPDDIPVLEQCIETRSQEPLNKLLDERFDGGDIW